MTRTLNILHTYTLEALGDDWKGAYVRYTAPTIADLLKLDEVKDMSDTEATSLILSIVKAHAVDGKVSVVENGQASLVDLMPEDVEALPLTVITELFSEMSGAQIDPKDTPPAAQANNAPSNGHEPSETPSSTA
jgi:hypothetical protein